MTCGDVRGGQTGGVMTEYEKTWKLTVTECEANGGHCWRRPGDDGMAYSTYEGAPQTRWCKHCGLQQMQIPASWRTNSEHDERRGVRP